jgi:pyruvate dehydrogenase (quinone)
MKSADPINPQRVFWELSKRLPDNCIMTGDSGTVATGMPATSACGAA